MNEAAGIFLMSALGCVAIGRPCLRLLARAHCVVPTRYADCPPLQGYEASKHGTPTMGGLFVLGVGIGVAVLAGGLNHRDGWLVLGAILSCGLLGLLDDRLKFLGSNAKGVPVLPKLLIACGIGALVGLATRAVPLVDGELTWWQRTVESGWGSVLFSMVVVAGSAHAVNLTDGMDGLAAGCLAIALVGIGLMALHDGSGYRVPVLWCASLAGACVGFLWFNSYPASVFLGDVGALGLGAALGTLSLLTRTAFWLPLIGGVFVVEAVSVMLQVGTYKWCGKRRLFRVAPIHHHIQLGGVPEPKVTVRLWLIGVWLAIGALGGVVTQL